MVVSARSTDCSSPSRVGGGGDVITVKDEVSHVGRCAAHFEAVFRLGRDHYTVKSPILEGVACSGCGCQRTVGEVVVSARSTDCSSPSRVGCGGDVITVKDEVSHIVPWSIHFKGILGIGRDFQTVLGPVDKMITYVRSGSQSAGCKVVVNTRTCRTATYRRGGINGDFVTVNLKVGHISLIFGHSEGISNIGGDLLAILGPVEEMITYARYGRQGADGIIDLTDWRTAFGWVGRNGYNRHPVEFVCSCWSERSVVKLHGHGVLPDGKPTDIHQEKASSHHACLQGSVVPVEPATELPFLHWTHRHFHEHIAPRRTIVTAF